MPLEVGKIYTGKQLLRQCSRDWRRQCFYWIEQGDPKMAGYFARMTGRAAVLLNPKKLATPTEE